MWVKCDKAGCKRQTKPSPSHTDKATGKVYHDACRPRAFEAKGKSPKVKGYKSFKLGDGERSTPNTRAADKRRAAKAKKEEQAG